MTDADTHGMITHILAFWISFMEITRKKKTFIPFSPSNTSFHWTLFRFALAPNCNANSRLCTVCLDMILYFCKLIREEVKLHVLNLL